jgi:hypothetical protein
MRRRGALARIEVGPNGGAELFAIKPSAIIAKVVTLAGGRTNNFWELGNALLILRGGSRYRGDFKRTVQKAGLNLRQAYYLCEYEVFKEAVERNGSSIAPRKNLVGKELAVIALIKKAASSK